MVRELSPELANIAVNELNEHPNRLQDDLQHLKDWISKQPYLKARTDDQWLIGILRGCKHSLERVKKKLDLYYTLKTTAPDVTLRIKPTETKFLDFLRLGYEKKYLILSIVPNCIDYLNIFKKLLFNNVEFLQWDSTCIILPKANELYPRVFLIRAGKYDPSTHHVIDIICVLYYLVQILLVEDDTATVLGIKIVTDYDGVSLAHFSQATPTTLKKMIAVCQDSMPFRLKGSHHVNIPSGIDRIFTLIRGLLNEKARDRLRIHKNNEDLLQTLPKEIVPAEYGGNGGTLNEIIESWSNKIKQYKPWFQQEEQFGTDESKRPGKAQTASDMFGVGVDGSFRKLDID